MIIPTNDLINYEGSEWSEYLKKLCLYDIFKELCEEYGSDIDVLTGLIRFIVWTYSIDSTKIVLKQEWVTNKKKIFKAAGLPEILEQDVIFLKNHTILYTIKRWLNSQEGENYSNWAMLNDLISEFRIAANSPIRKSTGEIDYEAKRKCAESVLDLLVKKAEVEQKFIQNNDKLKEAYKEVNQMNNRQNGNTFGLETMLRER